MKVNVFDKKWYFEIRQVFINGEYPCWYYDNNGLVSSLKLDIRYHVMYPFRLLRNGIVLVIHIK